MFIVTAHAADCYMHATSVDGLRWNVTLENDSVCTSHTSVGTSTVLAWQAAVLGHITDQHLPA